MNSSTPAAILITGLEGQEIHIPCLFSMFKGWPSGVNPNYERMVDVVNRKLNHIVPSLAARTSLADFALLTGAMYPYAAWPEYLTLTTLVLFFFLWDDEIEDGMCSTFSAGQQSRRNTVEFIKHCLGLGTRHYPTAHSLVVETFRDVGEHVCEVYTVAQRKLLLAEMLLSAKASQVEQQMRIQQTVPTLEEYQVLRSGTIAVGPYLALGEFVDQISLQDGILHCPLMRTLRREACAIVSIINDLVSLQKELAQDEPSILSYIPLSCAALSSSLTDVNAQRGADFTVAHLRDSIQAFDVAATSLLETIEIERPESYGDLKMYINTVRTICTGTLRWSLTSIRYGMAQALQEDGSLTIQL